MIPLTKPSKNPQPAPIQPPVFDAPYPGKNSAHCATTTMPCPVQKADQANNAMDTALTTPIAIAKPKMLKRDVHAHLHLPLPPFMSTSYVK